MKNILLTILSAFLILSSTCNKEDIDTCNTPNPLTDLAWLKQIKETFDKDMSASRQKIDLYLYNEKSVFKIIDCADCADGMETIYNCAGQKICEFGGIAGLNTCPDFQDKAKFVKNMYNQ